MHKVSIDTKGFGGTYIGMSKLEMARLIRDWKRHLTEITDYRGVLWMGTGKIQKDSNYTVCLRPSHITGITVDGVSVPYGSLE